MRRMLTISALALGLPAMAAAQDATATMTGQDGTGMGQVTLTDTPHGLLVQPRLEGVPGGGHGFHIHETGACEGDFTSAGGHYAPDGNEHGFDNEAGYHAGDLPNVFASAEGNVEADMWTTRLSVSGESAPTVLDEDGSAIILHEMPDTYGDEASAGGRIACGVIEAAG